MLYLLSFYLSTYRSTVFYGASLLLRSLHWKKTPNIRVMAIKYCTQQLSFVLYCFMLFDISNKPKFCVNITSSQMTNDQLLHVRDENRVQLLTLQSQLGKMDELKNRLQGIVESRTKITSCINNRALYFYKQTSIYKQLHLFDWLEDLVGHL